ncbi:MAG TPA: hypothetical protein VHO25_07555, partial [Polyangiaceae bacterium]|nr:hypothetical protein [Polyangiaceae bacterium]
MELSSSGRVTNACGSSNRWVLLAALSSILGTSQLGCSDQQGELVVPAAGMAGLGGSPGFDSGGSTSTGAGAGGIGGVAGEGAGGDSAGGGTAVGPLVELPQELMAAYPTADAPRSCFINVTLEDPSVIEGDAGADTGVVEEPSGELPESAVSFDAGIPVHRPMRPAAPQLLSQSGCFADMARHQVSVEFVPYLMRSPLFTDAAHKDRFFSIPVGT